ncbi:MAG: hypothetical protein AAFR21_14575 [Pseudomonadota bacterium]
MTDDEREAERAEDHATLRMLRRAVWGGGVALFLAAGGFAVSYGSLRFQVQDNTEDIAANAARQIRTERLLADEREAMASTEAHFQDIEGRLDRMERMLERALGLVPRP